MTSETDNIFPRFHATATAGGGGLEAYKPLLELLDARGLALARLLEGAQRGRRALALLLSTGHRLPRAHVLRLSLRAQLYDVVNGDVFTAFIYIAIMANTAVLIADEYPKPPDYRNNMSMLNFLLALVFLVEMILKWIAMGLSYFEDPFNNFDCAIVWISIITMICAWSEAGFGGGAISAFRCFRVFRLLKVLKTCLPNLMVLLSTASLQTAAVCVASSTCYLVLAV